MSIEVLTQEQPNQIQQFAQDLANKTHHIVKAGNILDAGAIVANHWAAPRFDTRAGVVVGFLANTVDAYDGASERYLGTADDLGAIIDAFGDRVRVLEAAYYIWKNNQAPKPVLALVAGQNLANSGITILDRALNVEPQVKVIQSGRTSMLLQTGGVGIHVIGNEVAKSEPSLGRAIKIGGTIAAITGFVKYGAPTTKEYWNKFKAGERKPWVNKVTSFLGRTAVIEQQ